MSAYLAYLDSAIAQLTEQAAIFKTTGREDEAALCRIETNIDDICRTIYHVCKRTAAPADFRALYLQKLDRLPQGWEQSRTLAAAHGDSCKAVIEEIKLKTLARNRVQFLELDGKEA